MLDLSFSLCYGGGAWSSSSKEEFSVSLCRVFFVCSLIPRNAPCMEAVSYRTLLQNQDTAGRRNQIPGQFGYLRISVVNSHPWKREPDPLPARISASLCNPTSHNVERTRREKGKLLQTQWARNAKRHHSWPDKGTKTWTRTQGQQRLAPPGVLCWESLHHVPLAKDAARYLLSPKSLPQPWSQSFWREQMQVLLDLPWPLFLPRDAFSDPLFTESYFPKMSLNIQYPVMRTRATCCFGNASA